MKPAAVAKTVMTALEAEADGDLETRRQLLETAVEDANSIVARWQLGQISLNGKTWNSIEDCIALANKTDVLDEYKKVRSGYQDTVDSNLSLAQWCAEQNLLAQARAHLERVIDLDPDHQLARSFLGYRQMGNEWISPEQISRIADVAALKQESIRKYQKKITKLIKRMGARSKKTREMAIEELMELDNKDAVGAVEAGLASESVEPSRIAIEWMDQIDTVESSQVLARYSLMHPDPTVRAYATRKLVTRPKHDFVPDMLGMLSSQISMSVIPSFNSDGMLTGYRQAFAREDFDGKEFVTIDRGFQRSPVRIIPTTGGQAVGVAPMMRRRGTGSSWQQLAEQQVDNEVRQQAGEEVMERMETMQEQNQRIGERNKTIAKVIAEVAQKPYTEVASEMWSWWDNYNDTDYQTYKPERYQRERITTSVPRAYIAVPVQTAIRASGECFVAGTPVMTCHGLQNIEDITTGDLVLGRNIETGELKWNPVLRPTVRPPSATVNISIDGESFCCSTGHLLWVSGAGWKKASELAEGDVLHGAERPSLVTAVSPGEAVETHNLEVADNANYFVGQAMIMAHDVTPRQTNRQRVPGQSLLQFLQQ